MDSEQDIGGQIFLAVFTAVFLTLVTRELWIGVGYIVVVCIIKLIVWGHEI